jgi:hypothetical protein
VEQQLILEYSEKYPIEHVIDELERFHPTVEFTIPAVRRFLRRLKETELQEDVEESGDAMNALAASSQDGRARDGVMEAMRRRMYAQAMDAKDGEQAAMVFNLMRAEQKEARQMALEERKVALQEQKAREEVRLKELEMAKSALKLLPRIQALLCDEKEGSAEERLARAREVLMVGGAALLAEKAHS